MSYPLTAFEQLCPKCRNVFERRWTKIPSTRYVYDHHESLLEFYAAVEGNCPLCTRVHDEITRLKPATWFQGLLDQAVLSVQTKGTMDYSIRSIEKLTRVGLFLFDRQQPQEMIPVYFDEFYLREGHTALLRSTEQFHSNSKSTEFVDIAYWYAMCAKSHCCGGEIQTDYMPPRLLDCENPQLRLVERSDIQDLARPYATVSHCWGSHPTHMMLTTSNIEAFYKGIPLEDLPSTFRDAVKVVQKLQIRYLWIDSLCIIQAGLCHESDWQRHVKEMAQVYAHGSLNIAAAHSTGPQGGCFATRSPSLAVPCLIKQPDGQVVGFECHHHGSLETFHLNSRAWVFQERLLSPRIVHFDKSDVFWECNELVASGAFPDGQRSFTDTKGNEPSWDMMLGRSTSFGWQFSAEVQEEFSDVLEYWYHMVMNFSRTNITRPEDRLPAIAAIAQRINEAYLHERYIAGFFESQIGWYLLWQPYERFKVISESERHEKYVAPSWSWASFPDPVQFSERRREIALGSTKILKIHLDLVDNTNMYGQLKSASMVIKGPTLEVPYDGEGEDQMSYSFVLESPCGEMNLETVLIDWDYDRPTSPVLILLAIDNFENEDEETKGLVLIPDPTSRAQGKDNLHLLKLFRVGQFKRYSTENEGPRVIGTWSMKTITIV